MKKIFLALIFLGLGSLEAQVQSSKLDDSMFSFQNNLYKEFEGGGQNLIFSPFSIYVALSMAYLGSESETKNEFEKVLGLNDTLIEELGLKTRNLDPENSKITLSVANAFFTQKGYTFEESYKGTLKKIFNAKPLVVDFSNDEKAARREINEWVEDKTDHVIKNLVSRPLSPLTRGVLVNAIYFRGKWQNPFDINDTRKSKFKSIDSTEREIDFLNGRFFTKYQEDDEVQVLDLAYENPRFSMMIFLPKNPTTDGLASYEQKFAKSYVDEKTNNLVDSNVQISIPKFRADSSLSLPENLARLGLRRSFSEKQADFSRMSPEKGLHISEVIHKAYIEVQEEGTKAAAATSVVMEARSLATPLTNVKIFKADHPFLYILRDKQTGLILFMGKFEK